jgi:hypothetical protein
MKLGRIESFDEVTGLAALARVTITSRSNS